MIERITAWVEGDPRIDALLLVGSYARGTANPESDIDLVLIVKDQSAFLRNREWIRDFGTVDSESAEDWGAVQSVRVFYKDSFEIEFGPLRLILLAE